MIKMSSFLWDLANAANLATEDSPNVIFYGAPGTGKTYSVTKQIKLATMNKEKLFEKVQFHPSFTYEDFIDGLKPIGISDNGNMKFEFVNGVFKNFCIEAKNQPNEKFYFVVDEINRANLSVVLGETFSLLEANYRDDPTATGNDRSLIKTQNCEILQSLIADAAKKGNEELATRYKSLAYDYDDNTGKVRFGIPQNIYFVGMMNDVDKSIDTFDLALRRRFKWIQMGCNYDVISEYYAEKDSNNSNTINDYSKSCKELNEFIKTELGLGSSYEFGHAFFMKMDEQIISKGNKKQLFENHLKPTLREYLRGFFDETEIDKKLEEAGKRFGVIDKKAKETEDEN